MNNNFNKRKLRHRNDEPLVLVDYSMFDDIRAVNDLINHEEIETVTKMRQDEIRRNYEDYLKMTEEKEKQKDKQQEEIIKNYENALRMKEKK